MKAIIQATVESVVILLVVMAAVAIAHESLAIWTSHTYTTETLWRGTAFALTGGFWVIAYAAARRKGKR